MKSGFWETAKQELTAGRSVFLALVAANSKGSPGTTQSALLVKQDGSQYGTIGGGIMEKQLIENALLALSETNYLPRIQKIEHKRDSRTPSGLICGGWQQNALLTISSEADLATVTDICDHLVAKKSGVVIISNEGLGFESDTTIPEDRLFFENSSESWSLSLNLSTHRRITIFGAGHCGQALAKQMDRIAFEVTLFDERTELPFENKPSSISYYSGSTAEQFVSNYSDWQNRYVVVMTHSYPSDLRALSVVLPKLPKFAGLMGSPPKLKKIFRELSENGLSQSLIERIQAPVGLPIGSDTPEEIAISVSAQILQHLNASEVHEYQLSNYATA